MKNIIKGEDGKYRWVYEFKLMKNPAILLTIIKIFALIFAGIWVIGVVAAVFTPSKFVQKVTDISKTAALMICIMTALSLIGYIIYAAMMGWKYVVIFDMDENGVTHTQLEQQAKKAEAINLINVLAGLATMNPRQIGIGLTNHKRTSLSSNFANVKTVKAYPKMNLIKVNEPFAKNQVYVEDEDFEFVYYFIKEHTNCK